MDITTVIEDFKQRIRLQKEECGDSYLIAPFFQRYSDQSVTLKFYQQNDDLYLSDCGTTLQYLYDRYLDVESYREKIQKIKKRFFLTEENGEFILQFPSDQIISIEMFVGFFVQALTLIANVDID